MKLEKIKLVMCHVYTMIYGFFHPIQKKILFLSFSGTSYSDSQRAISEKMHEMYPEFELVWKIKDKNNVDKLIPDYVRVIDGKLEFYRELATCFAFVNNCAMTYAYYKKKHQFFVQTWHGDRALKKILFQLGPVNGVSKLRVYDYAVTDICVAGSNFGEELYKTAFKYNGEIVKMGIPRNDKLITMTEPERKILKHKFNIDETTKIVLYAPTFRDNANEQEILIDVDRVLNALCKNGEKWICFVRIHPGRKTFTNINDNCIDVSDYPDMTDLLNIADMLISDYSSCATDYVLRNKPVILAVYDLAEYESDSREFCVDLNDTGFVFAKNNDELEQILLDTTEQEYIDSCKNVLEFYGTNETGKSTEYICNRIKEEFCKKSRE